MGAVVFPVRRVYSPPHDATQALAPGSVRGSPAGKRVARCRFSPRPDATTRGHLRALLQALVELRGSGSGRTLAVVAAVWALAPAAAHATANVVAISGDVASSDVAIMVTRSEDSTLAQAGARLRPELRALGFDSHFANCATPDTWEDTACGTASPSAEPLSSSSMSIQAGAQPPLDPDAGGLARARREPDGFQLAIFLGRADEVATIEVIAKLSDGWKPFRLVYVPPGQGGDDSSVLATRALELLHDVLLDIRRWEAARSVPVAERTSADPGAPSWLPFHNWRLTAAVSVLQGRRGLGASVAPSLGIATDWGARVSLLATLAGPFYKDLSASELGTASTRQEFAALGLRYTLGDGSARPFLGVATGVYHLLATTAGAVDHDGGIVAAALWAPFASVGGGGSISIARWLALVGQADLLVTAPAGEVTLGSTVLGRAGGPSFLIQTGACFFL